MDKIAEDGFEFNKKNFPAIFFILYSLEYYITGMHSKILKKMLKSLEMDKYDDVAEVENFFLYQMTVIFYDFNQVFSLSIVLDIEKRLFNQMFENRKTLRKNMMKGEGVANSSSVKEIFLKLNNLFIKNEKQKKQEKMVKDLVATQYQLNRISQFLSVLKKNI